MGISTCLTDQSLEREIMHLRKQTAFFLSKSLVKPLTSNPRFLRSFFSIPIRLAPSLLLLWNVTLFDRMQHTSTIFHLLRGAPHEHLPDDSPERFGSGSIQTREGGDVVKGVCPSPSSSVASTSEIPIIPAQLRRPPGLVVEQEGKQGDKEDSEMIIKQEGKHTVSTSSFS